PGACAGGGDHRHGARRRHAHAQAGRHRKGAARHHGHQAGAGGMHQVAKAAAMQPADADLFARLEELNSIGVSLSKEKDITRLLEKILIAAKTITNADGGTLYRINDEGDCQFEIMRTDSLAIAMGG